MSTWDFTGQNLDLETTPASEDPDVVSGNVADCYICGKNFGQLAKFVRECVVKLEYNHRDGDGRLHSYAIAVCIWCHSSHILSSQR